MQHDGEENGSKYVTWLMGLRVCVGLRTKSIDLPERGWAIHACSI